ncbi:Hypothetical protein, putative [Bodo saltans]|uniref:Uncharacterized protein n=1 Tax=Bodo saltans TaxID=75058 RepID=A0A0S4J9S2_BODSA|nr:Hypothetical protein, putative [Bodo saltans]|eukprot:CUG86240.1 Hypothetical protein, putative [Bodo saltans]
MSAADALTATEFVSRLGNICISVGTHRDYLQRHVEHLEAVERQCRRDVSEIESLEEQLSKAVASAERVASMSRVLETARRSTTNPTRSPHQVQHQQQPQQPIVTSTTSMTDIIRFSKAAESFDGEAGATSAMLTHVDTAQAQVARLDFKLQDRTNVSVRNKLARLEALKSSCREVDVVQCLQDSFTMFQYSPEAEEMFFSVPSSSAQPPPPRSSTEQSKQSKPQRASLVGELPIHSEDEIAARDKRLVRSSNVAKVLQGAVERLTLRYADALNALVQSGSTFIADQKNGDIDRLLYAAGFSQLLADASSDSVQFASYLRTTVQNPTLALQQEYDYLCRKWVATAKVPNPRFNGGGDEVTALGAATNIAIINAQPHIVLPMSVSSRAAQSSEQDGSDDEWSMWSKKLLSTSPLHNDDAPPVLPPAKHILTQRFSAADVEELQSLEKLRIRIQQTVAERLLQLPASVAEQLPRLAHDWHRTVTTASDGTSTRASGGAWTVFAKKP